MKPIYTLLIAFALVAAGTQNSNAHFMSLYQQSGGTIATQPQVSPNPAQDYIKITWQQFQCANVIIRLYNTHGALVRTFTNQEFCDGTHRLVYKLGGLQRGSYLLRVQIGGSPWSQSGAQTFTQKLLIQ